MIQQVTVVGPPAQCICCNEIAHTLRGLHGDRVFADEECAGFVFQFAPHAVQVNRVIHHRVVDQHDAEALAVREAQRLGLRELLAVEGPDEALHVAGEMELNLAARRAAVDGAAEGVEIGVGEHFAAVVAEADARVVQTWAGLRDLHVDVGGRL